jgi:hypothetical protein
LTKEDGLVKRHYNRSSRLVYVLVGISLLCAPLAFAAEQKALPRGASPTEIEVLCKDIQELVSRTTADSAYSYSIELRPKGNKVSAILRGFFQGKPVSTQKFTIPGITSKVEKSAGTAYLLELHAKEYWNLGLYDESTANALHDKLTRLNAILESKK